MVLQDNELVNEITLVGPDYWYQGRLPLPAASEDRVEGSINSAVLSHPKVTCSSTMAPNVPPSSWRPWSDLPLELAYLVLRRLPAHVDRIRVTTRAAAGEGPLPPPPPLLALPDGTVYSLPLDEPFRFACSAGYTDACENWLVVSGDGDDKGRRRRRQGHRLEGPLLQRHVDASSSVPLPLWPPARQTQGRKASILHEQTKVLLAAPCRGDRQVSGEHPDRGVPARVLLVRYDLVSGVDDLSRPGYFKFL
ncbi:hypothetical protein EJB05_26882, partial [Eragrostis curvula]